MSKDLDGVIKGGLRAIVDEDDVSGMNIAGDVDGDIMVVVGT